MRCATNTCLTLLLLFCAFLSVPSYASEETTCQLGVQTGMRYWDGAKYGNSPYICLGSSSNCKFVIQALTLCDNETGLCYGSFVANGQKCSVDEGSAGDKFWQGGELVEVDDPDDPSDPNQLPVNNYLESRCDGSVCKGNVVTNPAIMTNLLTASSWAHFMNNQGYTALTDALTLTIPQKIFEAKKETQDKIITKLDKFEPNFDELQSSLSDHASTSTSQFYRLMDYVAGIPGYYSSLNTNLAAARSDVYSVKTEMQNKFANQNATLTANQQALSDSLATVSGEVSGLADGLEALSSQISGAGGTGGDVDLSGVESKLQGIQETLDGKGMVGRPFEGQVDFEANGLYGTDAIENLEGEIEQLETKYQEQMEQFKSLFTFDESELADGTYVEHKWTFRFANGQVNSFTSGVFPALLENSSLIAAVLLFLAVLLGIKALTD